MRKVHGSVTWALICCNSRSHDAVQYIFDRLYVHSMNGIVANIIKMFSSLKFAPFFGIFIDLHIFSVQLTFYYKILRIHSLIQYFQCIFNFFNTYYIKLITLMIEY